jgi:hypothetical protein
VSPQGIQSVVLELSGRAAIVDLAFDGQGNLYFVKVDSSPMQAELLRLAADRQQTSLGLIMDSTGYGVGFTPRIALPRPIHGLFAGAFDAPTDHHGDAGAEKVKTAFEDNVRNAGAIVLRTYSTSGYGQHSDIAASIRQLEQNDLRNGDTLLFYVNCHGDFDKPQDEWISNDPINCGDPGWQFGCVLPCDEPPVYAQYDPDHDSCRVRTTRGMSI